jgi:hypothetical protein
MIDKNFKIYVADTDEDNPTLVGNNVATALELLSTHGYIVEVDDEVEQHYIDKVEKTRPELDDFFDLEDAIKCFKKLRLNSAEYPEEERAKHLFYRDEVLDLMEQQIKTHKEIDREQSEQNR